MKKEMLLCRLYYLDNGIKKEIKIWVAPEDKKTLEKILNLKLWKDIVN